MTDKPKYVDLDGGGTVFRPPYMQTNARLTGWLLKSDRAAQQRILDEAFNHPSRGAVEYRALTSTVLMCFADIQRISSLDPRDSLYGYSDEVDVVFWMLAGAYVDGELDHLVFYTPYIWVTNPFAIVAGREVHGFPKGYAWVNLPTSPSDPGPLWAEALVIPEHSPSASTVRRRIFEIERAEGATFDALDAWDAGSAASALRSIVQRLISFDPDCLDWDLAKNLVEDLLGRHVPLLFLKQYRDAETPDRACYQAIVEANATVTDFRGAGLLPPDYRLTLHRYDSLRLVDRLALDPRPHGVPIGFWMDFSFSMDLGKVVWRAR